MLDINAIPDRFIGWSLKRGFYDARIVAADKLAYELEKIGLAYLIDRRTWIEEKADQLCAGCLFNEALWQEVLARKARTGARRRRNAASAGGSTRKRS